MNRETCADTVTGRAARFIASLQSDSLPAEVAEKARTCMLYGWGIGLLCVREQTAVTAGHAMSAIDGPCGPRGATALVTGLRVPVSSAVFANPVLLHSRCQEDSSGTSHLGVVVLSVSLAMLEAGLAAPEDMLAAVVAGYEVAGTLEAALGRETMKAGLRASPLYGAIAAAATAARLLALPVSGIDAALANAAAFTGGTLQTIPEGSDEWRYQVGVAARTGLLAATLAQSGSVSARQSIEGPQGFVQAYARRGLGADELQFGRDWRLPHVTFKPYPVCAHNQTAALIGARIHATLPHEQIAAMKLHISSYLVPGLLARGPFSRVAETLMSTAFVCASGCVHGTVTLAQLNNFHDEAVHRLMQRIEIVPDDQVAFPAALAQIRTTDDRTLHVAEQRSFADFSLGRTEAMQQLLRLADEERVPSQALQLLETFAFGDHTRHDCIRRAFSLARGEV